MKNFVLCLFLVLVCSSGWAKNSCESGAPAIDRLFNFIQTKKISTQVDFFKTAKADPCYASLLQNPVLAPVSFALHNQEVSAAFPRIIMHQKNMTIMTNGDVRDGSSNILEIITFDEVKKAFLFSLINFASVDPNTKFIRDASYFKFEDLKDPSFKDLTNCALCHALDGEKELRPRWGLGPIFQIPFGQADEKIFANSKQMQTWQVFLKTLNDKDLGVLYRYLNLPLRENNGTIEFVGKPNQSLAHSLEVENLKRVGRFLKTSPMYPKYQCMLVATLLGYSDAPSFLSNSDREAQIKKFKGTIDPNREGKELLTVPDDQLLNAIGANIEGKSRRSVKLILERVAHDPKEKFDLTGLTFKGQELSSLSTDDIISLVLSDEKVNMAKLAVIRFLFEDSVYEKTEFWSTHMPFAFGSSYRFSPHFLDVLLLQEIGPDFLRSHPELNFFRNGQVALGNLTIPKEQFISKLRAASLHP
jgi:hypothetical protein